MRKLLSYLLTASFLMASVAAAPAFADEGHRQIGNRRGPESRHDRADRGEGHWRGDIHHFRDYDFDYWRAGRWFHGFHEGRDGWWWVAGSYWYIYPAPVYPYPDPYIPPGVVVEVAPAGASSAYYYCANPAGYYPYVPQCAVMWQKIVTAVAVPSVVVQPQAVPAISPRDADFRQLNAYADAFYHIDLNDPYAGDKLKKLGKEVGTFRKSLYRKNYNAMDILKDTEDLRSRISAQRKELAQRKAASMPLTALPPGSTVILPPQ